MGKTIKENIKRAAVKAALSYLDSNPEENIPKLINAVEKLDRNRNLESQIKIVRESFMDKSGNWHTLFDSLYTDIDKEVRKKIFENFVINATVIGLGWQSTVKDKNCCNVPWAILLDPTSACNLSCKGCWAAEYEKNLNLPISLWDSVIWQGKAHGTFVYLYSGGEPLVRKEEIIKICEEHSECIFAAFTNATLIDENFADEILRVKNFIPIISVEGFQKETDFRRGDGVYASVLKAMEILKRKRLLFGVSCCYTSQNAEVIGSEEYIDACTARFVLFVRQSRCLQWISGMTANMSKGASPEDDPIYISIQTETSNPAHLSTIPIPISKKRRCWRPTNHRFLCNITLISHLMRTIYVPALF